MQFQRSLLLVLSLAASHTVFALPYTDFDIINRSVGGESPLIGSFDLNLPGGEHDSATMSGYANGNGFYQDIGGFVQGTPISSATISIWLSDPYSGKEGWAAYISAPQIDFSEMLTMGGSFTTHFQATDISDYGDLLVHISNTGKMDYQITALNGSFQVDAIMLEANPTSVPDGGATSILMGLGFLSIVGFRKLRK